MTAVDVPVWLRKLVGKPVLWAKSRQLARFRAQAAAARAVQERRLAELIAGLQGGAFARDHGLGAVRGVDDLRRALPVAGYERVAPYVERAKGGEAQALFAPGTEILMFALTSGTTAAAKYIPVTRRSLAEYRTSWTIWGCGLAEAHPEIPFAGVLNLASSWRGERTPGGVPCGSISGFLFEMMHGILGVTNVAPPVVTRAGDADQRLYLALRLALGRGDMMMATTANPSTLLLLAQRLDAWKEDLVRDLRDGTLRGREAYDPAVVARVGRVLRHDRRDRVRVLEAAIARRGVLLPRDAWPRLELLGVWTGGTLTPYLSRLPEAYGPVALRDHGLSASEGRMTIPLADGDDAGVLNVAGPFCEFVPESEYGREDPRTLLAHELEPGQRYYLVVTTSGGLVRYDMADCVECAGFLGQAPRLRFLHKGSQIANITGEKLSAFQATEAVRAAAAATGGAAEWMLVPDAAVDRAGYVLLLEHAATPELAAAVDAELMRRNVEYADKRRGGRLMPLRVELVAEGTFARLRDDRVARTGGTLEQYKHPFLVADHALAARLLAAAAPADLRKRSG